MVALHPRRHRRWALEWLSHAMHTALLSGVGERHRPKAGRQHDNQQNCCNPTLHYLGLGPHVRETHDL